MHLTKNYNLLVGKNFPQKNTHLKKINGIFLFFLDLTNVFLQFSCKFEFKRLNLMLMCDLNYKIFNFQKIFIVLEISKIIKLTYYLNRIEFLRISRKRKNFYKKKAQKKNSIARLVKQTIIQKFILFSFKKYPILIDIHLKKTIQTYTQNKKIVCYKKYNIKSKNDEPIVQKQKKNKRKLSVKNFYNSNLYEYSQLKGWFDTTGRRVNSFSMILDQTLYLFEKFNSLLLSLDINFQTFFKETFCFLTKIKILKNDRFQLYLIETCKNFKKKNFFNHSPLKSKILDESAIWDEKYSNKIEIKTFLGHNSLSIDNTVEILLKYYKIKKKFRLLDYFLEIKKTNILKDPFENFNLYYHIYKKNFLDSKINSSIFKKNTNKRIFVFQSKASCIFDSFLYRDSFSKVNFSFHQMNLFILTWVSLKNSNFLLITSKLFSSIFLESVPFFSISLKKSIKKTISFELYQQSLFDWRKKVRKKINEIYPYSNFFLSNIPQFLSLLPSMESMSPVQLSCLS